MTRTGSIHSPFTPRRLFIFLLCCVLLWHGSRVSGDTGVLRDGDLVLGGLFPIHNTAQTKDSSVQTKCGQIFTKGVIMANAMIYAVDLVNSGDMLPYNITLGYHIRDTCNNLHIALKSALEFADERKRAEEEGEQTSANRTAADKQRSVQLQESLIAVIGAGGSELSIAVNNILGVYDIPQISYASTSTVLSDKIRYRTFLRLAPPDNLQAEALASLVAYFGWKYVSVLYSDDNYGRPLQEVFLNKAELQEVCLANKIALPYRAERQTIKEKLLKIKETPKSKVILLFTSEFDARNVLEAAKSLGLEERVWIASDSWSSSLNVINQYLPWTRLLLGSFIHQRHAPGLKEGLIRLLTTNENLFFNTTSGSMFSELRVKPTTHAKRHKGHVNLDSSLAMAENVVNCVYAAAQAIKLFCRNLERSQKNLTDVELKRKCLRLIKPESLLKHLFNTTLRGYNNNTIAISESGDPPGVYDFLNLHVNLSNYSKSKLVTVGSYDSLSNRARINKTALYWTQAEENVPQSKCSEPCIPGTVAVTTDRKACCWDCKECPYGHVSNISMASQCTQCPDEHIPNKERTECVHVPLMFMQYGDPWGVIIVLLCLLSCFFALITFAFFVKHRSSPVVRSTCEELSFPLLIFLAVAFLIPFIDIGQPTDLKCTVSAFAFGTLFTIILSLILATISRTVMVFEGKTSIMFNSQILLSRRFHFGLVLLSFLVQCIICLLWFFLDPPHSSISVVFSPSFKRYVFCNEGNTLPLISISYLALLSLICTGLAYRSRNLPENYNNAKFIAFAMFTFDLVGFTFLGAYHGTSSEGHRRLILRSCAVITSGLCILLLIFGPKLYVILFRPELNNLRTFRKMTMEHALRTSSVSASVSLNVHGTVCMLESHLQEKAVQTVQYSRDVQTQTDACFTSSRPDRKHGSFRKFLRRFSLDRGEQNGRPGKRRSLQGEVSGKTPRNQVREEDEVFVDFSANSNGCDLPDEELEMKLLNTSSPLERSISTPLNKTTAQTLPKRRFHSVEENWNMADDRKHMVLDETALELDLEKWPEWAALKPSEII